VRQRHAGGEAKLAYRLVVKDVCIISRRERDIKHKTSMSTLHKLIALILPNIHLQTGQKMYYVFIQKKHLQPSE
jgi:hypothetical protein